MTSGLENWAISAYSDGELDPVERANVERLLESDGDARRVLDGIQRQKNALKSAYDSILDEPVPPSLLNAVQASEMAKGERSSGFSKWAMAASVAALFLGGTAGWFGANWNTTHGISGEEFAAAFPERALDAHVVFASDIRHPVEVSAADPVHLRTWLEKRVGAQFGVPDLSSKGYTLIGGRLLAEGDKPAGLLMYEEASTKQRLSIYFAKNARLDNSPMRFSYRGKLMTCFWTEPDLVYALAGEQTKEQMLPLAELAHDGFEVGEG